MPGVKNHVENSRLSTFNLFLVRKSPPRSNKWRHPRVCRCPLAETAPNYTHLNMATKISSTSQSTYIYEHHRVCPLVGIGTPPTPLPHASECAPPPGPNDGGHTRLRLRGWGSPHSDEWRKKLSTLPTLCSTYYNFSQEKSEV
jgi:hypothetical protein